MVSPNLSRRACNSPRQRHPLIDSGLLDNPDQIFKLLCILCIVTFVLLNIKTAWVAQSVERVTLKAGQSQGRGFEPRLGLNSRVPHVRNLKFCFCFPGRPDVSYQAKELKINGCENSAFVSYTPGMGMMLTRTWKRGRKEFDI